MVDAQTAGAARTSANKRTVASYMEAFARWDHAAILALLTDDVEWVIPGVVHRRGKAEFDAEIEGEGASAPPDVTVTRLVEDHDVVVAEGFVRAPVGDAAVHLRFCDVFEMQGGRIRRLISYLMQVPEAEA